MPLVSLNEAVVMLLGEKRRTAQLEIGRVITAQNELQKLAVACHTKLKTSVAGRIWLAKLSPEFVDDGVRSTPPVPAFWPPDYIVDVIGDRDFSLPESLLAFYDVALRIKRDLDAYSDRYTAALNWWFEAGRQSSVCFYGSTSSSPRAGTLPITASYFQGRITIDGDRKNLTSSGRNRGAKPGFVPAARSVGQGEIKTYFDVQIEFSDIKKLLASTAATLDTSSQGPEPRVEIATEPTTSVSRSPPQAGTEDALRLIVQTQKESLTKEHLQEWFRAFAELQKVKPIAEQFKPDDTVKLFKRAGVKLTDLQSIARGLHRDFLPKSRGRPPEVLRRNNSAKK